MNACRESCLHHKLAEWWIIGLSQIRVVLRTGLLCRVVKRFGALGPRYYQSMNAGFYGRRLSLELAWVDISHCP
jgi:hypothetical protein